MKALQATLLLLITAGIVQPVQARGATQSSGQIHTLDSVKASAPPLGPPVWKFTRNGKKILVLGTISYLPRNLPLDFSQVTQEIAGAQAFVSAPGLVVGDNIGFFRGLFLWPGIRKNRLNEDGRTLRDVLPPALFSKWEHAESIYGPVSSERLRPAYAAFELFDAAANRSKLDADPSAISLVRNTARKQGLEVIDARLRLPIWNPKQAVRDFRIASTDDVQCLRQTLDRLDDFLRQVKPLGDAWAAGDVGSLEAWANDRSSMAYCWSTLTNQAIARQQGISDLHQAVDDRWMQEIGKALASHDTVFTTMSLRELFEADGIGAKLRRIGFEMGAPN